MTAFDQWMAALETRHLADLQFREVTRALRALSSTYVERRGGLREGAALAGAGKRAAFALFYGPLHYLLLRAIVQQLPGATGDYGTLVDLGCGTGAAGAGWASACARPPMLRGVDRHPWAVHEANAAYRDLGLSGRAAVGDIGRDPLPAGRAVLSAFALNELSDSARQGVLARLLARAAAGDAILIVEPLAKSAAPWWTADLAPLLAAGGQVDQWRVAVPLPPMVRKLDQAAGLRHRELKGRSLWIAGASTRERARAASS
jgi:hypothetical protein